MTLGQPHQQEAEEWLERAVDKLDLRVTNYSWPQKYLLDYHDIALTLKIENKEFLGRGGGSTSNEAIVKAMAEAIERAAIGYNDLSTSNGLAAHFNSEEAKKNAKAELIERDQFFCHFLTKANAAPLDSSDFLSAQQGKLMKLLEEKKIETKFYKFQTSQEHFSVSCVVNGKNFNRPFGLIVGLGCCEKLSVAAERAFLEALRSIVAASELGERVAISLKEFSALKVYSPKEHRMLASDLQYASQFSSRGLVSHREEALRQEYEAFWFYKKLNLPPLLVESPFVVYQAINPRLQGLYFGPTTKKALNWQRLEEFAGRPLKDEDIEWLPHPLA